MSLPLHTKKNVAFDHGTNRQRHTSISGIHQFSCPACCCCCWLVLLKLWALVQFSWCVLSFSTKQSNAYTATTILRPISSGSPFRCHLLLLLLQLLLVLSPPSSNSSSTAAMAHILSAVQGASFICFEDDGLCACTTRLT